MTKHFVAAALALGVVLAIQPSAEATIVSVVLANSTDGPNSAVIVNDGFGEDVDAFIDRTHEWNGTTAANTIESIGLLGADYIQFSNDDKGVANYTATVTMGPGLHDLFLFWDNRDAIEQWALDLGFVDTGNDIGMDEGGNGVGPGVSIENTSSVYKLSNFGGNTVVLLLEENNNSGNMYGFAAQEGVPEPATATLGLLALGGLGVIARRRRR